MKKWTCNKHVQFIGAMRMKKEIFVFKEVEFHKIDEISNIGHVHVINNSSGEEYKMENIKNFRVSSQQIIA